MKIELRGANRSVKKHSHEVQSLTWPSYENKVKIHGKVENLSLGGDFYINITFECEEIVSGVERLIEISPEKALLIISELHAKSIIAMNSSEK